MMTREAIAKILQENITPVFQDGTGYVIHGAIDKIIAEHYKAIEHCDKQFNALVDECNELADAGCRHDLGRINDWVNRYTNDENKIEWRKILTERKLL